MPALSEALVPTERDVIVAKESQRQMGGMKFGRKESVAVQIDGKEVAVPVGMMQMMIAAVARLAEGKAVAMMPVEEEISPQEAAEILKVSRPYAAKLFDEGAIPSRRVGTHRRALSADVLAYKQREKEARLAVLDELAAEGQRLKMGY
ncbi:MAG: helix-turn-helix domain-containing protein [Verrucomicrobiaceae bacterium]|nr:helix-turn-helix domain-containing protein [Verrucomicrobiaceae bacterium]